MYKLTTELYLMFKTNKMDNSQSILDSVTNEFDNIEKIRDRLPKIIDLPAPRPKLDTLVANKENNDFVFKGRQLPKLDESGEIVTETYYIDGAKGRKLPREKTVYEFSNDPERIDKPETQLVYNDRGQFLGHTGMNYESIQPETFLNSFVASVENCDLESSLDLSKLEYREYSNGRVSEFYLPLKSYDLKPRGERKIGDVVEIAVSAITGYGGYQQSKLSIDTLVLSCLNGMTATESIVGLKAKHTEKMNKKVVLFCDELIKTVANVDTLTESWEQMNLKSITEQTIVAYTKKLAGIKLAEKVNDQSARKQNIYNSIRESVSTEMAAKGNTVWGLLNGVTHYTNHVASGHENPDYIKVATGARLNEQAQRQAMELIA